MPWAKIGTRVMGGALVPLGTATLSFSTTVGLLSGTRTISLTGIKGLLATDRALFIPDTIQAGYSVGMAVTKGAEQLDVPVTYPAIAINGAFTIPGRVFAIR